MKESISDHSHDLLVKYLLQEASPEERISVEQWLQISEDNRRYYTELETIWQESKYLAPSSMPSEEEAWQRFRQRATAGNRPVRTLAMPSRKASWLRVAAVFLLLVGSSYFAYFLTLRSREVIVAASDTRVVRHTLPDGSEVVLNRNASIAYSPRFGDTARLIRLNGEGFFNVAPDPGKPFVIEAGEVSVTVLGTSFNIKRSGDKTEVVVETGSVRVRKQGYAIELRPQEKAVVPDNGAALQKLPAVSSLYQYYRTNQFVCIETPLPELVSILNEAYDVHIVTGSRTAAAMKLTTTLDNKSLEQVLEVIRETLGISIEKKGNEIILK